MIIGLFHKNSKHGGLRTYFLDKENPEIFRFIILPLKILDKRKLYPCKFCEFMLHSFETPRPIIKTYCMEIQFNMIIS